MLTTKHVAILITIFNICYSQEREDYFRYHGPNISTSDISGFSKFVLLREEIVSTVNETEIHDISTYFPKCCPPGYLYEEKERKCRLSNDTSIYQEMSIDVNLIKIGLSDCDVIVDHVLSKADFSITAKINKDASVIIGGTTFKLGQYCMDNILNENNHSIVRVCHSEEYCWNDSGLRCLKKCCADGEMYIGHSCGKNPEYGLQLEEYETVIGNITDQYAVYHQNRDCSLYPTNISEYEHVIDERGGFYVHVNEEWKNYTVQDEIYCFEVFDNDGTILPLLLMCSRDTSNDLKFVLSKICQIFSCICLLLTMIVYSAVYKLEKVRHRVVFCYCLAHGIGFGTLTYIQFDPTQETHCKSLSFTVLFGFLAAFAWLNTMCYDIWKTMGSMKKASENTKKTIYYNIYAWSVPALITVFCYLEHTHKIFPHALHAHVGEAFCILENKLPDGNFGHTIFFILPILTATISNIVFFGLTIKYITDATDSIRKMNDNRIDEKKKRTRMLSANKKKIFMALKLFLVMGVNWTFEIVSSIISFKHNKTLEVIELIFDTFNCLQGFFVFAIFVLKWDTIRPILGKLKVLDFTNSFSSSSIPLSSSNGKTSSTPSTT